MKNFFEKGISFFRFLVIYLRDNIKRLPAVMVMQVLLPAVFYGLQYLYFTIYYDYHDATDTEYVVSRVIVVVLGIVLFLIMLGLYRVVHARMAILHRAYYMVGINTSVIVVAVAIQSALYATCGILVGMLLFQLTGLVCPGIIELCNQFGAQVNAILWASYVLSAVVTNLLAMLKFELRRRRKV